MGKLLPTIFPIYTTQILSRVIPSQLLRITLNVRQSLCVLPQMQHPFNPTNYVSTTLRLRNKITRLHSIRRSFAAYREARRRQHASTSTSSSCAVYLDMIYHIVLATINNLMLATGVGLAYFLCLRSSEYVSKTIVPIDDGHQFRTTEAEVMINDGSRTFIASNKIHCPYSAIKLVKFSMLHAKNIRRDNGVTLQDNSCIAGQQRLSDTTR